MSALDLWNAPEVDGMVYRTHPFVVQERQRNRRRRTKRVIVFGEATDLGGTVTFHFDNAREESYPVDGVYDANEDILIWQECSMDMTGYVPDVELNLTGSGVVIRDTRMESVILD